MSCITVVSRLISENRKLQETNDLGSMFQAAPLFQDLRKWKGVGWQGTL